MVDIARIAGNAFVLASNSEVSVGAQVPMSAGGDLHGVAQAQATAGASRVNVSAGKSIAAALLKEERDRTDEVVQHERDNRFTPPELIRQIEESFGKIEFDPCWHPASAVHPIDYLDVRQGHNGLQDSWKGRLAFVNPPFSKRAAWVRRSFEVWRDGDVELVLVLTPAATSDPFFNDVIAKYAHIFTVSGRPRFLSPTVRHSRLAIIS